MGETPGNCRRFFGRGELDHQLCGQERCCFDSSSGRSCWYSLAWFLRRFLPLFLPPPYPHPTVSLHIFLRVISICVCAQNRLLTLNPLLFLSSTLLHPQNSIMLVLSMQGESTLPEVRRGQGGAGKGHLCTACAQCKSHIQQHAAAHVSSAGGR